MRGFCSFDLAAVVVFIVNILNALSEHVIDRVDGFLDVLRPRFEKVTDCWHAVLKLGLANIVHV